MKKTTTTMRLESTTKRKKEEPDAQLWVARRLRASVGKSAVSANGNYDSSGVAVASQRQRQNTAVVCRFIITFPAFSRLILLRLACSEQSPTDTPLLLHVYNNVGCVEGACCDVMSFVMCYLIRMSETPMKRV